MDYTHKNDHLAKMGLKDRHAVRYSVRMMNTALKSRFFATLFGVFIALNAFAQQGEVTAEMPELPGLASLESNWWDELNEADGAAEERINAFLADASIHVNELSAPNRAAGQIILDVVSDNFSAYRALLDEPELKSRELPEPALSYSIDDLLALAAESRNASVSETQELLDVEREQRILAGASRRRDLAFKDYINAGAGDEKILAALTLVQTRSAQAIAARRLELLTKRYERAADFAAATSARVDYASGRLAAAVEPGAVEALLALVDDQEALVAKSREALRAAELAATNLDLDTAQGRSEQQLRQVELLEAEVVLALNEVALAETQAKRWWVELQLAGTPDLDALQDQSLSWSELMRRVEENVDHWQQVTEDELLVVQTMSRDGLDRASRRLLDQRLGTAQDTLTRINELTAAVADLKLTSRIVDDAFASYSGALTSWLTSAKRNIKAFSLKVMGLGDVTLFSVGEAPVTGGDILWALVILIIAFLLSRGVRHTINRVGRSESAGRQASLYTVGRLTHYAIIISALFIALTSIGLDFSNLALIAGALGVGIGFGLQSIVSNFVSGLMILFEQSLRVGDYIELDTGLTGTVKAINVRSTLINTNDNIDIVVPNSEFVTTRLTNWTLGERILRIRIPFGVAYGSDKELVRKAAIEAAEGVQYTLTHMPGREPDVWLVDFGDSSLDFLLLVWVNLQGARRPTRSRAAYLWALETKLAEYGIEIPFPQRDLNLRRGWSDGDENMPGPGELDNEYEEGRDGEDR